MAGEFKYICPVTIWLVKHVVIDYDSVLSGTGWRTEDLNFEGSRYRRLLNIKSTPARTAGVGNVNPASFMFRGTDPGTTSNIFKRICYKLPTEITSLRVQHECPSPEAEQILMQATMSLIDAINDHKKQLAVTKYIETVLKPQYQKQLDIGEQGVPDFCVKRKF